MIKYTKVQFQKYIHDLKIMIYLVIPYTNSDLKSVTNFFEKLQSLSCGFNPYLCSGSFQAFFEE